MSWIDRGAAVHSIRRSDALRVIGMLPDRGRAGELNLRSLVDLTAEELTRVVAATGAPSDVVCRLLLGIYDGAAIDLQNVDMKNPSSFARWAGTSWVNVSGSLVCPMCVAASGGVWMLQWKLGWAFACEVHRTYLTASCPRCGSPIQKVSRDRRLTSTRCASSVSPAGGGFACGMPLTAANAVPASPQAMQLQRFVWDAIGETNAARQISEFLTWAKLARFVARLGVSEHLDDAPSDLRAGFRSRREVASTTPTRARPVVGTPRDPRTVAAALFVARRLMADPVDGAVWSRFYEISQAAYAQRWEWRDLRTWWAPPEAFARVDGAARAQVQGTGTPALSGRATVRLAPYPGLGGRHVPSLLWKARWAAFQRRHSPGGPRPR